MTRLTEKEQMEIRKAKDAATPFVAGKQSGFGLLARFTDYLQKRAAVTKLSQLDDRLLKDIGLCRADIHPLVYGNSNNTTSLFRSLSTKFADARRRRRTIQGLNQLSDRMLADIGVMRADITPRVDQIMAGITENQVLADLTPRRDVAIERPAAIWGGILPQALLSVASYVGFGTPSGDSNKAANNNGNRKAAA
ncbi:MAG: DUF1127 domain-containing protein [Pseudomonadota bacterium]